MTNEPVPAWSGMLSQGLERLRSTIEPRHPEYVRLAQGIDSLSLALIIGRKIPMERPADYMAASLFGRTILDFEATILLAGNGFRAQSRSMARSAFESACYCVAACRDHPTLFDAIDASHQKFRRNVADELQRLPETPEELVDRLKALSATLASSAKPSSIKVEDLANGIGMGLYTVLYRQLSQDAHPSATSMEHHVTSGPGGEISGFKITQDFQQYDDTLLAAIAAMLMAAQEFAARFGSPADAAALEAHRVAYIGLSELAGVYQETPLA